MSIQPSQLRNPDTVLPPASVKQLAAQTDQLVDKVVILLRHHVFDNTAAFGSIRHIPKAGQNIVETFTHYISGQVSQAELIAHVKMLIADGLVPAVAVYIADCLYEEAIFILNRDDEAVKSVISHYRQEFLRLYMELGISKVLIEQEAFYQSLQSMLEERIEKERLLGLDLEAEQNLALERVRELEVAADIIVHIAAILDPANLLQQVTKYIYDGFDLYHVHLFLFDAVKEELRLVSANGEISEQLLSGKYRMVIPYRARSLVARAARTRKVVVAHDVKISKDFMAHELLPDTQSELVIPLLVGDKLLGLLDMHAISVNRFNHETSRILAMLGAQTAVSLQNARQHEQTEEALENLSRVQQSMAHENWQAFLSDDNRKIKGYMFDNGQVSPITRGNGVKTAVTVNHHSTPMKVRDTTIGFLDVRNSSGEQLTTDEQLLLDGLSRQISDALERARLLETTELGRQELDKRAEQLAVINDVAQVVSQQLDENQLFTAVHEQVARAVITDTFFIAMYDAAHNYFTFPYFYDDGEMHHPTPMNAKPELETVQVWKSGEPIYVNYTPDEFWERENANQNLILTSDDDDGGQKPSNVAFIPLMAGAKTIGVMSVQNYQFHDFTEDDISLLFGIANHVGLALENLRLFANIQRRAERERLINEISQKIQGAQTVRGAMQTAVSELGRALKVKKAVVELN